jgi:hypothetical protein
MAKVSDLFEINNGININKDELRAKKSNDHWIAYVGASGNISSSIVGYLNSVSPKKLKIHNPGEIYVSTNGSYACTAFVSNFHFITNIDCAALIPKKHLTVNEKNFYALCITRNRYKFSYGRKPKGKRLADIIIPDLDQIPSWVYTTTIPTFENITESYNESNGVFEERKELRKEEWKEFRLGELFEIEYGSFVSSNSADGENGNTPYITTTANNNGIGKYILKKPNYSGNSMTLSTDGSIGEIFYQKKSFTASNINAVLIPIHYFNKYVAFFLMPIIKKESFRYGYGRKWSIKKVRDTIIKLPTNPDGSPDWLFMENYIKSLKYSGSI